MHVIYGSYVPILRFFAAASDGATANRQIPDIICRSFFASLMKERVTNYGSILTLFPPSARGWMFFTTH